MNLVFVVVFCLWGTTKRVSKFSKKETIENDAILREALENIFAFNNFVFIGKSVNLQGTRC